MRALGCTCRSPPDRSQGPSDRHRPGHGSAGTRSTDRIDGSAARAPHPHVLGHPRVTAALRAISRFGGPMWCYLLIPAVAVFWVLRQRLRLARYVVATTVLRGVVDTIAKLAAHPWPSERPVHGRRRGVRSARARRARPVRCRRRPRARTGLAPSRHGRLLGLARRRGPTPCRSRGGTGAGGRSSVRGRGARRDRRRRWQRRRPDAGARRYRPTRAVAPGGRARAGPGLRGRRAARRCDHRCWPRAPRVR